MMSPAGLAAQVGSPYGDRYVPYGSPLDPLGTGQTVPAQSQASSAAAQQSATRIEPVEVYDRRGRSSRSDDPQDVDATADEDAATNGDVSPGRRSGEQTRGNATLQARETRKPAEPSEFERYVERALGRTLPRFGQNLLVSGARDFALPPVATVPPAYVLSPGDTIFIGLTGSVEGTVDATIDNNGRIFLPKVGSVRVAGVSYADLRQVIDRAIGRQYRDYRVTVSISRLRGLRVYVTGFANNPGAYTVNSLSTMVNAVLAAGGPSAGGSFRSIRLMRGGKLVSDFDLYDLLRNGDRTRDATLQNEDVLYVPPVGQQVAISGSVNDEAIYEARPGESLESLLRYAGGINALGDASRVILYRLSNLDTIGGRELARAEVATTPAAGGDLVQVLSAGSLARSLERQSVVVRLEGEVARPGNYYVPPNTSLAQVLELAGGLTSRAFVFGTNLQRLSVRLQQRASFKEALDQLELSLASAPLRQDTSIDAGLRSEQLAAARATLERLRRTEPDGRVVLNLVPTSLALPGDLALENSDRIYVPPRPTTVGVFGAVYRPASFLIEAGPPKKISAYLTQAGGPQRAADKGEILVVRANGEVLSRRAGALGRPAVPGDLIFVPIKTQTTSVLTRILQFSTLLFQFGITAAAIDGLSN